MLRSHSVGLSYKRLVGKIIIKIYYKEVNRVTRAVNEHFPGNLENL